MVTTHHAPTLDIVLSTALLGGTERQILLYLQNFDRSRISPRVLITQRHELSDPHVGSFLEELDRIDVPNELTPSSRFYHPRGIAFLARHLHRPSDVTMLFGFTVAWAARILLWPGRSRVINGIRNANVHRASSTMKIEGILSGFVDLYVSNSHAAKRRYNEVASIPSEKIVVIPNSLDVAALRRQVPPDARAHLCAEFGLQHDALIGINVSNIQPRKGHLDLIEAISRLKSRYPNLHFLFVGQDKTGGAIAREVERQELRGRIHVTGFRRDVPTLIAGADLMVHPSYSEGMSNAIMEGMALGIPIVASDVGDSALLVEKSGAGIAYPARDIPELTSAVEHVLREPRRAERWGERGALWAEREFSIEVYVERTTRIVEILAAGGDAQACHDALNALKV